VSLSKITKDGGAFIGSQQVDEDGRYCFGTLPPGKYELSAGAENFQKMIFSIKIVSKNDGSAKRKLNIMLQVGG
jgi:protocatechuate 3,4-dioxygenase beta subunit